MRIEDILKNPLARKSLDRAKAAKEEAVHSKQEIPTARDYAEGTARAEVREQQPDLSGEEREAAVAKARERIDSASPNKEQKLFTARIDSLRLLPA
jgi:hypothetical protein